MTCSIIFLSSRDRDCAAKYCNVIVNLYFKEAIFKINTLYILQKGTPQDSNCSLCCSEHFSDL